MKRFRIIVIAAVAVLGVAALGGAAVRANASADVNNTTAQATAGTNNQNGPDGAEAADKAEAGQPDTDNVEVQEGDQTSPDTAAEAAGEKAGSEVLGNDGPGGHADEPDNANADHEFEGVE